MGMLPNPIGGLIESKEVNMSTAAFGVTSRVIVKVQIPFASNRVDAVALVYDRGRKHLVEQPISQKTRDALKGDTRAFFEASFDDGYWTIYKRVPEQFW